MDLKMEIDKKTNGERGHGIADNEEVIPSKERNITLMARTKAINGDGEDILNQSQGDPLKKDIQFGIEDCPPWYMTILLGLQHYLLLFGGTVTVPLLITPAMCIGDDNVGKGEVISTVFFIDGIATLLQSTFGTRLPIVQGGSYSFIAPILAVLALPKWQCPEGPPDLANLTSIYGTSMNTNKTIMAWRRDLWTSRMREIQGSMALASIFQIMLGLTGLLGMLLPLIGPLCIAPTIALIGLALFGAAADYCAQHWGISFLTIALITLFSQYIGKSQVPFPAVSRRNGCHVIRYPIFQLLPVIIAIVVVWCFCAMLTAADVFPSNPHVRGYKARTDVKLNILNDAKWFIFPYPGQWGFPTFSAAAVIGIMAGMVAGMIESLGDYYACAQISEAPPPPIHAINRGIFFEGIGITCAAIWGSTSGVTSYSHNIGAIGITKVASRRVIQVGGLVAMLLGMFGKFGAIFVTLPEPIFGGIFMTLFGLVAAIGVSCLRHVDLNSSRNLFIFGFSLLLGLSLPHWVSSHREEVKTGHASLDQLLFVLLNTPMLIGGVIGFLLDNTIPGTAEERGLTAWRGQVFKETEADQHGQSPYDLPFGMDLVRRVKWLRFLPISPTYQPPRWKCCRGCRPHRGHDNANEEDKAHYVTESEHLVLSKTPV